MGALSTVSRHAGGTSARLWEASALVLAAMPLAMAIAHRSSPLMVTLATVLALAALASEGQVRAFYDDARAALWTPVGAAAVAFMAWAGVSVLWSETPGTSVQALVEFFLTVGATAGLALLLPGRVSPHMVWIVVGAVALACTSMLLELATGMGLRRAIAVRTATYIFNRPVLTTVMLLAPVLLWLDARSKGLSAQLLLLPLVAITAAMSESGAAVLALLALAATFGAARALPRATLMALALVTVAALGTAPVIGEIAQRTIPPAVHGELVSSHSQDRVEIWRSFGAAIRAAPVVGSGFGSSPKLDTSAEAARVAPELQILLGAGHPHNAAIQIWAELGVVGAVLAAMLLLFTLRELWRLPAPQRVAAAALLGAAASVSLIGHGAWQGWWAASIGAAVVWFRVAARQESAP
jgi:exopolysaccharide production protein ExoQ